MPSDFLHNHPAFPELLRIIEDETGILAGLVEKDDGTIYVQLCIDDSIHTQCTR